jgi:hypothetical protein
LKRLNSTTDGEFNIPTGVAEIKQYTFKNCDEMTKVTIPANVTSIGESAFAYCENLKNIVFKEGNKNLTIEEDAFHETGIKELKLPDRLTKVNEGFSCCYSLESIMIGASLQSISDVEFWGCSNIKKFQVSEKNTKYDIPVSLKIYDLVLPEEVHSRTHIGIWY